MWGFLPSHTMTSLRHSIDYTATEGSTLGKVATVIVNIILVPGRSRSNTHQKICSYAASLT